MNTIVKFAIPSVVVIILIIFVIPMSINASDNELLKIQYACFIPGEGHGPMTGYRTVDNGTHIFSEEYCKWTTKDTVKNIELLKSELYAASCENLTDNILNGYYANSPIKEEALGKMENCKLIDKIESEKMK